jgi:hypothetical protein
MADKEYREVWVAENTEGRPIRSSIDRRRMNDQADVFRYVPADAVCSAWEYLENGNKKDALRILRSLVKR